MLPEAKPRRKRKQQQPEITLSQAAALLGRKGGSAKSERKTAAVRLNGLKGGRPKGEYTITLNFQDSSMSVYRITWVIGTNFSAASVLVEKIL